ncbi:hypothetical protein [Streptomyces sp. bgisy100]|uniref:hypothetical protein n=1 Tax=Streptomyces sp. bgisy100 TaxID=3413783 RepID=UPI003D725A07
MRDRQLPDAVTEFADYLRRLLDALDPETGWYGVFAQRDPEGVRACLAGSEVLPWDVVDALLQDLAVRHGEMSAEQQRPLAERLHRASVAAHDRREGGRDALLDRLDVMRREQQYAGARERELADELTARGGAPSDGDGLATDLAWARDDHERAAARCAELRSRLAVLDEAVPPPGEGPLGFGTGHEDLGYPGFLEHHGFGGPEGAGTGPAEAGAGRAGDPGRGADVARDPGAVERTGVVERPGAGENAGGLLRGARFAGLDEPAVPAAGPEAAGDPEPAAVPEAPWFPAAPTVVAPPQNAEPGAPGASRGFREFLKSPEAPEFRDFRDLPEPVEHADSAEHSEPARPRGARFAGAFEAPRTRSAKRAAARADSADSTDSGTRWTDPAEAGQAAAARDPEPADDSGQEAPAASRSTLEATPSAAGAAARSTTETVARLAALRAAGSGGAAYVVLCEAVAGPPEQLPSLFAALEGAGLAADVATLLWEAACLPPSALAAAAGALSGAGRTADCGALLRQAVARPPAEVAEIALALLAADRSTESDVLLTALLRTRTPEEAVRVAESEPGKLVPLLLGTARRISRHCRRDLAHALRMAGAPGAPKTV